MAWLVSDTICKFACTFLYHSLALAHSTEECRMSRAWIHRWDSDLSDNYCTSGAYKSCQFCA